jgi:hypothetical protein
MARDARRAAPIATRDQDDAREATALDFATKLPSPTSRSFQGLISLKTMFNGKLDIVWPAVLLDPPRNMKTRDDAVCQTRWQLIRQLPQLQAKAQAEAVAAAVAAALADTISSLTAPFKDAAAVLRQELDEVKAVFAAKVATVETTMASRLEARLDVATSQATLAAAAAAAAATTAGDGQAGWPTAKRGGKSRLAAGAAAVRPDDAANAEGQLLESGQRQRKEMDLRVVVKTGTTPAPEAAEAVLDSVLQHRVQLPQQEVAAAMQDVAHIQVLPKRAGPGYTLLVTFRTPAIKAAVYRLRNAWRSNGSEGPALAIGHNLTAAQLEAHMRLFPSMQQIWAQEVPVQMLYRRGTARLLLLQELTYVRASAPRSIRCCYRGIAEAV